VKTGTQKAEVGAGSGAELFWKPELEPEPKQIVSVPQHCSNIHRLIFWDSAADMIS
jgi:hypothetical protein